MVCRLVQAVASLITLIASVSMAQVTELRKYIDVENPNTPVRGHAVVGVSIAPKPGEQEHDTLGVWLHGRRGQLLSVDLTTADGRVQGDALVRIDPEPAGATPRDWEKLSVPKVFRKSDPQGLAVGVQTPNDPSGAFYVASWGDLPAKGSEEEIWLYVNRGRAPQASLYWDKEKGIGNTCIPVVASNQLRFNTLCKVRIKDVPSNGELTLVRRDGGSVQSQKVTLVW